MKNEHVEYDNTCDVMYLINKALPNATEKKEYNSIVKSIISKIEHPLNTSRLLVCDSLILRCVDNLHTWVLDDFNKDVKSYLSYQQARKVNSGKTSHICTCTLIRRKSTNERKELIYTLEERLMLYILVSNYLQRVSNKSMILSDNFSYISIKNIHKLFGNESELKATKKNEYINIISRLRSDKIEIRTSNDDNTDFDEKFTQWFNYIRELKDYDGKLLGFIYSFDNLGIKFLPTMFYPTKVIPLKALSVDSRNLSKFQLARYIIYKIDDKSKKVKIETMLDELYDYNNGKTYKEELIGRTNPNNIKYLVAFVKLVYDVLANMKKMYDLGLYYGSELLNNKSIMTYLTMEQYKNIYIGKLKK